MAPNFMALDAITAPPVDFSDATKKARASVSEHITQLSECEGMTPAKVLKAVKKNIRLTFTYLIMQLHARGSQQFWRDTAAEDIFAYIAFRTVDQYADILTHIQVTGYDPVSVLKEICTPETLNDMRTFYAGLRVHVRALPMLLHPIYTLHPHTIEGVYTPAQRQCARKRGGGGW